MANVPRASTLSSLVGLSLLLLLGQGLDWSFMILAPCLTVGPVRVAGLGGLSGLVCHVVHSGGLAEVSSQDTTKKLGPFILFLLTTLNREK